MPCSIAGTMLYPTHELTLNEANAFEPDMTNWFCKCSAFKSSRFHICQHFVYIWGDVPNFRTFQRRLTRPFWRLTDSLMRDIEVDRQFLLPRQKSIDSLLEHEKEAEDTTIIPIENQFESQCDIEINITANLYENSAVYIPFLDQEAVSRMDAEQQLETLTGKVEKIIRYCRRVQANADAKPDAIPEILKRFDLLFKAPLVAADKIESNDLKKANPRFADHDALGRLLDIKPESIHEVRNEK